MINLQDLADRVNSQLKKSNSSARPLMSKFPYVTSNISERYSFEDPLNYPSYLYLGRNLESKAVVSMSLSQGLSLGCFLLGCKTVENVFGFHQLEQSVYYSSRMAKHNLNCVYRNNLFVYHGGINDDKFKEIISAKRWDTVIIDKEMNYDIYMAYLRFIWKYLSHDTLIIFDYICYNKAAREAYKDFCISNNRDEVLIKSKYGIGLLLK